MWIHHGETEKENSEPIDQPKRIVVMEARFRAVGFRLAR